MPQSGNSMLDVGTLIEATFHEVLDANGLRLAVPRLADDTILLASGLDSLGFAILVARLEERLGFDPFLVMDEPVYPVTFGDFVRIYEKAAQRKPA